MNWSLSQIAAAVNGRLVGADVTVEGVSTDTRAIAKGALFIALAGERFDLILFDLTQSDHPACAHLHSDNFLRICAASLTGQGIVHVQLGSPFHQRQQVTTVFQRLKDVFATPTPALIDVPLYGGPWLLARARNAQAPEADLATLTQRLAARRITGLRYYNPALHLACSALPNYVLDCLT